MKHFFLFFLLFIISSCADNKTKVIHTSSDLVEYASNFDFDIVDGKTFLSIINPETGEVEKKYFFKKKGQKDIEGLTSIFTPINSIAALSSTHIGMLNKLDALESVSIISDTNYIDNEFIKRKCREGKVKSIGEEGQQSIETILYSNVNVIMFSGFGKPFSHQDKLEKLGINCIPNYDWREFHPLGKAEWVKVFGYLLGKEEEAELYFDQIESEYLALKEIAENSKTSPSLFSGSLVGDIWYAPAGESFNAVLYKDANIDYVYKSSKGTGSISKSFEEVLVENQNTEYWLNPANTSFSNLLLEQPKMAYFKAVKDKQVYDYSFKMNFFWENSAIEPQKVLSDLIAILHPELLEKDKMYFYQQLKD